MIEVATAGRALLFGANLALAIAFLLALRRTRPRASRQLYAMLVIHCSVSSITPMVAVISAALNDGHVLEMALLGSGTFTAVMAGLLLASVKRWTGP